MLYCHMATILGTEATYSLRLVRGNVGVGYAINYCSALPV